MGVSTPVFIGIVLSSLVVLLLITFFNLFDKDQPEFLGTLSFLPVTTAIMAAYLVFTLSFALRNIKYPTIFLMLGVISYSLYLVQGTIFSIVPSFNHNLITILIWFLAITAVSFITYYLVEKPFISIGKRLQ
jgi:peptidoglycan/LPS O-acetylase OafA/YrhL